MRVFSGVVVVVVLVVIVVVAAELALASITEFASFEMERAESSTPSVSLVGADHAYEKDMLEPQYPDKPNGGPRVVPAINQSMGEQ